MKNGIYRIKVFDSQVALGVTSVHVDAVLL